MRVNYESEEPVANNFNCPKKFSLLLLVYTFTFLDPKNSILSPQLCMQD